MEFKELNKCLYLLGYSKNADETSIKTLLNETVDILETYVHPFKVELNNNMLSKDILEAKKDLAKHYIFEFFDLQGLFKSHHNLFFTGSLGNFTSVEYEHIDEFGQIRKLNKFENYVVNCNIVFDLIFSELQLVCFKYNIDFMVLCDQLCFPTDYFDNTESWMFDEHKAISKSKNKLTLTAPQLALRYWYLIEARIEKPINGNQLGIIYKDVADRTNVAKAFNDITKKRKELTKEMLYVVRDSLNEYPLAQKLVINDLDKLFE